MESSSIIASSKRRRLMVSFYVSLRPRPDLPARFELLNDDTKREILHFVGNKSYKSFGGTNKQCREVYLNTPGMTKETFLFGYAPLSAIIDKIERGGRFYQMLHKRVGKGVVLYNRRDVLDWALDERNEEVIKGICNVAGEEGRVDLLEEVWNNMNDEYARRFIFRGGECSAARHGKLDVLKWFDAKELPMDEEACARQAARNGHIQILQWLREEKGLELDRHLYVETIIGGHLHLIKWLREQEVSWGKYTFAYAANKGYLDILQFLHNEECPWPDDDGDHVYEEDLKPEVIEWLRTNGYSDRIIM